VPWISVKKCPRLWEWNVKRCTKLSLAFPTRAIQGNRIQVRSKDQVPGPVPLAWSWTVFFSFFFSPLASSVLNLVYDLVYPWQGAQLPKSWMGTGPSSCGAGTTPITINNEALASPWRENGGQKVLPSPSNIPVPTSRNPNPAPQIAYRARIFGCPFAISVRWQRRKKRESTFFAALSFWDFAPLTWIAFWPNYVYPVHSGRSFNVL